MFRKKSRHKTVLPFLHPLPQKPGQTMLGISAARPPSRLSYKVARTAEARPGDKETKKDSGSFP